MYFCVQALFYQVPVLIDFLLVVLQYQEYASLKQCVKRWICQRIESGKADEFQAYSPAKSMSL